MKFKIPNKRRRKKPENAPLLESTHEDLAVAHGRQMGWHSHRYTVPGERGNPDKIFLKKNRVFFIEFKREGGKLRPQQVLKCTELRKRGFLVFSSDNIHRSTMIINAVSLYYARDEQSSSAFFRKHPELEGL